jgi:hypothetical protein
MKLAIAGSNRSGMSRKPELLRAMIEATREFPPSSGGDASAVAETRIRYAKKASPFATMPPPTGVRQLAKTALRVVTGGAPALLLDKLGERLAFERSGARLYEALISKHDAGRVFRGGPRRDDLVHLRDEEHQHALLVEDAIRQLGGDPTVVTPSANLQLTASHGLCAVLADPRTDVLQGLEALLTAELVDNDCWPVLIELVEQDGTRELAERLGCAVESEREHLVKVRTWLANGTGRSSERALRLGAEIQRAPEREPQRKGGGTPSRARPKNRRRAKGATGRRPTAKGPARAKPGGKRRTKKTARGRRPS